MFGNAAPTPYDINFSLFGIPIRVHPLFWAVSAVMGWSAGNFKMTLMWVACVFVSILIHELGHALTAKSYGWPPSIVLYAFGGYASYFPSWGNTTWRRIHVLLAGPGAGFVFFGLLFGLQVLLSERGVTLAITARQVIRDLIYFNLVWGLFNLLPVYPLDGGQISHAFLSHWSPRSGGDLALQVSLVLAVAVAAFGLWSQQMYLGLLFGSLAFGNFQMLQGPRFR